jgi:hypothetical protein
LCCCSAAAAAGLLGFVVLQAAGRDTQQEAADVKTALASLKQGNSRICGTMQPSITKALKDALQRRPGVPDDQISAKADKFMQQHVRQLVTYPWCFFASALKPNSKMSVGILPGELISSEESGLQVLATPSLPLNAALLLLRRALCVAMHCCCVCWFVVQ